MFQSRNIWYETNGQIRYGTPGSGSHLWCLTDCQSPRLGNHGTTSPLTRSLTCPTRDQRPHLQVGLEDSQVPWMSFVSRASYGTCHSATPERSYHLLVKSARKVGVQMDLHLLLQPLGWHLRQLGSPWPVLIDQGQLCRPHW